MASLTEHTPQHTTMRETATSSLSSRNSAQTQDNEAAGQESASPDITSNTQNEPKPNVHIDIQTQTREVHFQTLPNRNDYFPDSALMKDILKNPALYVDRADF